MRLSPLFCVCVHFDQMLIKVIGADGGSHVQSHLLPQSFLLYYVAQGGRKGNNGNSGDGGDDEGNSWVVCNSCV